MDKRIVYITENNKLSIVIPSNEYLSNHSIEDVAKKDVPPGCTYYIVDVSEIPTDRTFREAWIWE